MLFPHPEILQILQVLLMVLLYGLYLLFAHNCQLQSKD